MVLIAHNIRSLHNVGSLFRSAEVFGVECLYLTGYTGTPPRKEIAKTALGSELRLLWKQANDITYLITELKNKGYYIVGLENAEHSRSLFEFMSESHSSKPIALVLGSEVDGIDSSVSVLCDVLVEIPMPGTKRSLNVSVAAGVALFAFRYHVIPAK